MRANHIDAIPRRRAAAAPNDPTRSETSHQLVARWSAAFVLDPDGATRTKALGTERMARKKRDALPGGDNSLRAAVWKLLRPTLSPTLTARHRNALILDDGIVVTTVALAEHHGESPTATSTSTTTRTSTPPPNHAQHPPVLPPSARHSRAGAARHGAHQGERCH